jgi:CRISPR-associated endonuclease Csn1
MFSQRNNPYCDLLYKHKVNKCYKNKKILGLDIGTNSIGWALINKDEEKVLGMGSRIIPMELIN